MSQPERIVILTPGFADSEKDLNCIPFQQQLILSWKKQYPRTELIIFALQYPYREGRYSWKGIMVHCFDGRNRGGIQKLLLRQKIKTRLRQLHKQKPITGLLSFWYGECAALGHWAKNKWKVPHYCWLWGQDARPGNNYPGQLKLPSEELIALSDSLSREYSRNYKVLPARVITAGIEKSYQPITRKDIDILGAGSLIPLKQYEIFVGMVASLKVRFPHIRAAIAGSGPEETRLREMIREAGLHENLYLPGELLHSELLALMRRSRIFLHPSGYEGFSIACLEAIYAGARVCSFVQPMEKPIANWTVVTDKTEMLSELDKMMAREIVTDIPDQFPLALTVQQLNRLFIPKRATKPSPSFSGG